MKNIIPLKKDVEFKTNISEITSISLENTLVLNNNLVTGEFIIDGDYKVSDKSTTVEPFQIKIPVEIEISDRFDTKKASIDIDDFYYEISNDNTLSISIDVLIDHLQENLIKEDLVDVKPVRTIIESEENNMEEEVKEENYVDKERCVEEDTIEEELNEDKEDMKEKINSIFSNVSNDSDVYVTYNVFIVREGDTLESIIEKYGTTEEELKKYNDLNNLKLGDKLIIPSTYERD